VSGLAWRRESRPTWQDWKNEEVVLILINESHKSVLDALLLDLPGVRPGKMFGYPAYYAGDKLSICLVEDSVGLKLPAERVTALLAEDPHTSPFQPLGRPKMREWLQINPESSDDLLAYLPVFEESVQFVLGLQNR
jgi:hypothetical protein